MTKQELIEAGTSRFERHVAQFFQSELSYYESHDWKDRLSDIYQCMVDVAEEAGVDPQAYDMPDGDNCPRAFREWLNS